MIHLLFQHHLWTSPSLRSPKELNNLILPEYPIFFTSNYLIYIELKAAIKII